MDAAILIDRDTAMSDLKLFVWEGEDVLPVVFGGMICVLAHDIEEALRLIKHKYEPSPEEQGARAIMARFPHNRYRVVEQPEAFALEGSDY